MEALRKQILKYAPDMSERLSRGVPFFYYRGKRAVGFRSSKNHLSFFIMEGHVLKNLRDDIASYDNSATVIKFSVKNPLPETLIKKMVLARIEEINKDLKISS
ncbi:MAG: DUF1801 domain-containing protein [Cytophagales bacterium]|nr:DUF1801 domain-containing protein [Cytophagales bacterium]